MSPKAKKVGQSQSSRPLLTSFERCSQPTICGLTDFVLLSLFNSQFLRTVELATQKSGWCGNFSRWRTHQSSLSCIQRQSYVMWLLCSWSIQLSSSEPVPEVPTLCRTYSKRKLTYLFTLLVVEVFFVTIFTLLQLECIMNQSPNFRVFQIAGTVRLNPLKLFWVKAKVLETLR